MCFLKKQFLHIILFFAGFLLPLLLSSQEIIPYTLDWKKISFRASDYSPSEEIWFFDQAWYPDTMQKIPLFRVLLPISDNADPEVEIRNIQYSYAGNILISGFTGEGSDYLRSEKVYMNKEAHLLLSFIPFKKTEAGHMLKMESFDLLWHQGTEHINIKETASYANNSVLSKGYWYKIGVEESGVYKLDYQDFINMGMDPAQIDPRNIAVFGNGGGMLPQSNAIPRIDDLAELPVFVSGENDARFDPSDYVLFYASGPHQWVFHGNKKRFQHHLNTYDDRAYYFVTVKEQAGKRIFKESAITDPADYLSQSYDYHVFHERDLKNDITDRVKSGRDWFGEEFNYTLRRTFPFQVPDIDMSASVQLTSSLAARAAKASAFRISINGNDFIQSVAAANVDYYDADYVRVANNTYSFQPQSGNLDIDLEYQKSTSSAMAWLDYLEINARRNLVYRGLHMGFRDTASIGKGITEYRITSANEQVLVWDITDIHDVKFVELQKSAGKFVFRSQSATLKQFYISNPGLGNTPVFIGKVNNQNLHAMASQDMIIISFPAFISEAKRLAEYHREKSGLRVELVAVNQIYNEFSSGAQDVTALRDFMKMLYDRAGDPEDRPKYLLLFGDASYDYKNRINNNSNFVPTFQSRNSYSPVSSYASDDYFGFLDDNEGDFDQGGTSFTLDLAIGRLPVQSLQQAREQVDKIIHYNSSNACFSDWRNRILFVADDEDGNIHINDSEKISAEIEEEHPLFNQNKVYFDAYQQVSNSNGHGYPEAKAAINNAVNSGTLIVNYIGHGGEEGWAHEKVLELSDIRSWNNLDKMSLFVTATCEFSRFDDPERISAGEWVLLNPKGGAIALLTTTRVVTSGANYVLISNLYKDNLFVREAGAYKSIGEIIRLTKNRSGFGLNTRKFALLGDPCLTLAYPEYHIRTLEIDEKPVSEMPDTLKALAKVSIRGDISDHMGMTIDTFQGVLSATVFDKFEEMQTLANDPNSYKTSFEIRKNIIYRGKATVNNGVFNLSFVVPRDISYNNGIGKISYYAHNSVYDAGAYYQNIVIGGTNEDFQGDDQGPEVRLFMNDSNFVFGGLTDNNPVLLALVEDENGINTVGTGIGHEIIAVLDDSDPIILNDYYSATLDNFRKGEIRYPFYDLLPGRHSLKLKVWDVANNSSTAYTEFVVGDPSKIIISSFMNRPNPFSGTTHFVFEINRREEYLDILLQIFDIYGKLVREITNPVYSSSTRIENVFWDGRNAFGEDMPAGIYPGRIIIRSAGGQYQSKTLKLVKLKR
jgi:hypothetical protein